MIKICQHCGKEFNAHKRATKFCSAKCMGLAKRKYPDTYRCEYCGKEVIRAKSDSCVRKYCSQECYHASRKTTQQYTQHDGYVEVHCKYKGAVVGVLLDNEDFQSIQEYHISVTKKDKDHTLYAHIVVNNKTCRLHRYIMQTPDDLVVDHINHNGLDNRRQNLRNCSTSDNCLNRTLAKNNKSGITGVCYRECEKAWRVHYRGKEIGYAKTLEEAKQIRLEAESRQNEI